MGEKVLILDLDPQGNASTGLGVPRGQRKVTAYDVIVSGAAISRSLIFTGGRIHSFSKVHEAVVLPYVRIGRNVSLTKCVIDAEVRIPDGLVVGEDPELDAKRFRRTEGGVTLITQPMIDKLGLE